MNESLEKIKIKYIFKCHVIEIVYKWIRLSWNYDSLGKYMNTDENIKAHSLSFLTFLRVPTFLSSLVSRLGWHCIAPHCKIILNKYTMMVPNTYFIPCSLIILFNATFSTPYHKYFQITQTTQSAFFFMDCKIYFFVSW